MRRIRTEALCDGIGPAERARPSSAGLRWLTGIPSLAGSSLVAEPAPAPETTAAAMLLLALAKRPLILVGGSNWSAVGRTATQRFAEASTRVSGTTLENPDFVALAKAYGFHAERISAMKEFPAAFERAMSSRPGAVLDLEISPEALTPRQTLSQMREAALAAKRAPK
jgi:thiamine pyrophosphate-dependent acetolactate synthase large subunit-like protein